MIDMLPLPRRRATAVVRTIVIATATFAILLVCFAIYQASQFDGPAAERVAVPRLPPEPTAAGGSFADGQAAQPSGVPVEGILVGEGRDVTLSLYRPQATTPFGEIAFARWEPVAGGSDELLVVEPEIRLETKDGHGVRVTARRATLEGDLTRGLNLRRGRLGGSVVVEYDRLTRAERAAVSRTPGDALDPSQIVRIDVAELEFDLEFSRVTIPRGGVRLTARDAEFSADDMELSFNEEEGLVERMRINNGGRLVLRELGDELGMSLSGMSPRSGPRFSVVSWLRATLQAGLEARRAESSQAAEEEKPAEVPAPSLETTGELPVFRMGEEKQGTEPRTVKYLAQFQDDIVATQWIGDQANSRLEADALSLLRSITEEDRARVRSKAADATKAAQKLDASATEELVVEWAGRLVAEVVDAGDERLRALREDSVIAEGSPVKVSSPDGSATCRRLQIEPGGSSVTLMGTYDNPAIVRSAGQGAMTGLEVHSERIGNELRVVVSGPGILERAGGGTDSLPDNGSNAERDALNIGFSEKLEVQGRFVTQRQIDFTGRISSEEVRVLDTASFHGRVTLTQGDTNLEADELRVEFDPSAPRFGRRQSIERLIAHGGVRMGQGSDLVTAEKIDVLLTTDRDGRIIPTTAAAVANVEAVQGERTIRARDRLIVDFEMVRRAPPPFDPLRAHAAAVQAGIDVTTVDWEAKRREHEANEVVEVGARRLRAFGAVAVADPAQALDLRAEDFDCSFAGDGKIAHAQIKGDQAHPATVHLDTFNVTGADITLNVLDQQARVPGPGRLSFRSKKNLDGRRVDEAIPISIEWQDWMKYVGRENRALFNGDVHAYSAEGAEFDCEQLLVEFDDVVSAANDSGAEQDWWIFQDLVDRMGKDGSDRAAVIAGEESSKQPAYLLATGRAVALMSETDPATGTLKSRARLAGPKLSVNLRRDVSKMLIEGHGTLLLEDYRPAAAQNASGGDAERSFFAVGDDGGPSNTLIEWHDFMSYDFSIDQTRFEGAVVLKHFSGAELERLHGGHGGAGPGRSTYLTCRVLTADFLERSGGAYKSRERRMGRLSAARLRQFQASGDVVIQDKTEGLHVNADRVVFERERELLAIFGAPRTPARIVVQRPNQLPTHITTQRTFYDLNTGKIEASGIRVSGR